MTMDVEKVEIQHKISVSETAIDTYKEKEREVLAIGEQFQSIYRKQEELLNEVLYYSKGTLSEQSARIEIENLELQYREVMTHLSGGQEELQDSMKKETKKQEQLEEDLFYLIKKGQEEVEHAKDSLW